MQHQCLVYGLMLDRQTNPDKRVVFGGDIGIERNRFSRAAKCPSVRCLADRAGTLTRVGDETETEAPRVFVSYSHDSEEHRETALAFTQTLRDYGIDAWMDRFVENAPPASWPAWMYSEIKKSDFVVMICTETYKRRVEDQEAPGKGRGARWEGAIITHDVYTQVSLSSTSPHVPVVFDPKDLSHIPFFVAGASSYVVNPASREGIDKLIRRFKGQPEIVPAPLGTAQISDPRVQSPSPPKDHRAAAARRLASMVGEATLRSEATWPLVSTPPGEQARSAITSKVEEDKRHQLLVTPNKVGRDLTGPSDDALALALERSLFDALKVAPQHAGGQ